MSGFVFYKGSSLLNGKPIIGILITSKSKNVKTGALLQTYILADNGVSPLESAKNGDDSAICGNCPHRRYHGKIGSCYVNLSQGPRAVMGAYLRGIYPHNLQAAIAACNGKKVRLGTYGDPAAIPTEIWDNLLSGSIGHTGYTHQWKTCDNNLLQYVMASVDSFADAIIANEKGYRTFRVRRENDPLQSGEFICPANKEKGKVKLCENCLACNGGLNTRKGNPVITVHGILASRFNK